MATNEVSSRKSSDLVVPSSKWFHREAKQITTNYLSPSFDFLLYIIHANMSLGLTSDNNLISFDPEKIPDYEEKECVFPIPLFLP